MATYSILSKAFLQCRVGFPAVLEGLQQGLCQNAENKCKTLTEKDLSKNKGSRRSLDERQAAKDCRLRQRTICRRRALLPADLINAG